MTLPLLQLMSCCLVATPFDSLKESAIDYHFCIRDSNEYCRYQNDTSFVV